MHRPLPGDHTRCTPGDHCLITGGQLCCGGELEGVCDQCDADALEALLANDDGELVSDARIERL